MRDFIVSCISIYITDRNICVSVLLSLRLVPSVSWMERGFSMFFFVKIYLMMVFCNLVCNFLWRQKCQKITSHNINRLLQSGLGHFDKRHSATLQWDGDGPFWRLPIRQWDVLVTDDSATVHLAMSTIRRRTICQWGLFVDAVSMIGTLTLLWLGFSMDVKGLGGGLPLCLKS